MTRPLGKFTKAPEERKKYAIDYSEWLDVGETLVSVTFEVIPATGSPVVVDTITLNDTQTGVTFFVSGGDDHVTYRVLATATTSNNQVDEHYFSFHVSDPGVL